MGNYEQLKQAISDVIKANGNQEITGSILQNVLLTIVSTIGDGKTFAGVANFNTNPGTPDQNLFYFATRPGNYPNFGLTIEDGIHIIYILNGEWKTVQFDFIVKQYSGAEYINKYDLVRNGYNKASLNEFKKGIYFNWVYYKYSTNEGYYVSPFYEIESNKQYRINANQVIWFDENFNQITFEILTNAIPNYNTFLVNSPENAKYVVLNVSNTEPLLMDASIEYKNNYKGNIRPYSVVKESSRLDLYPLWKDIPLSDRLVNLGLNRFLIDGYVGIEYDETKWYSLSIVNPIDKTMRLYSTIKEFGSDVGLVLLADFTATKLENSNFWIMKNTNSSLIAKDSWFIVDWSAITDDTQAIFNLYGYEGWALTKDIFKGGINENIDGIFKNWDSVFENKAIFDNQQTWQDEEFQNANANSTFSGWGCHIGIIKDFNAVELCVINREESKNITKIRVAIYKTNYNGDLIADKTFPIFVAPSQQKYITLQFDEIISNNDNDVLFLMYWCDGFVTRKAYLGSYVYTPLNGYGKDTYSVNGNMESVSEVTAGIGYPFYFKAGIVISKYTLNDLQIENIKERIGNISNNVNISLPNKIYAIVGDTLQMFFRGIIQSIDPYKYDILVSCQKGEKYPRYYEFTPNASDVGNVNFQITIKDDDRKILATNNCQLVIKNVVSQPSSKINVACFGDSLTAAGTWCREADRRLTESGGTPAGKGLQNIEFVGSKQNETTGYFGVGGWTWQSYTQKGRPAYRFQVTGVSSLSVGAKYSNNGNTFTIMEVNVTDSNGNILCSVDSLTPAPLESGTLTKTSGDGDNTITYTSVAEDTQNPLWDNENEKMSFIPYANQVADGQIDVVYTLLTWNGLSAGKTDFTDVLAEVKIFADTLHAEFPNAKLKIMGVQVPSVRGGMGANYGATGSRYADGYGMVVTALNMNSAYQEFANQPEYSDFVEFVNVSSQFDTEYNMPHNANANVNTRNSTTKEWLDTNGVHPDTSGYYQIADVVYRNFIANFCQ